MRLKLLIGIPVAAFIAAFGGGFIYTHVIEGNAPAKLTVDSTSSDKSSGSTTTLADDGTTDGTWKVSSDTVVGYRVKETLFGSSSTATGRTSTVTGSITIAGTSVNAGNFSVDMTSVQSDRSQRDGQFQGRIMDTSDFPTATFKLTAPITLSSVTLNSTQTANATGDLTLHGTTRSVTFSVTAKRVTGQIRVSGEIPVHFADYNIDNPSGGPASVGDDGTLEFTLVLIR
jgi:polyisoprenoid-binding protein YceI